LVQHYYNIDSDSLDDEKWKDKIYTMIKYQWKEMLIPIGAGEYHSDMFTHKDDANHVWFLYGPLTLFVVKANHHNDIDVNPRTFLNEHVSFYSPVGGQVQIHTKGTPIEYGKHNKIMSYEEATNVVQNASVRKVFYNRTSQRNNLDDTFIKKMKILKDKTLEEIRTRYAVKIKFDWSDEEYMKLRTCLSDLSNGNVETMYSLIQNFDRHKGVFIQSDNS